MKYDKYEIIHYKPVGDFKWRKAEVLDHTIGKLHLRVTEPLLEGCVIEIQEDKFYNFYYEVLEQYGTHVKLWEV